MAEEMSKKVAAAVDLFFLRMRSSHTMVEYVSNEELMPDDSLEVAAVVAASLLTDDLIVEILSRLPVRSVHRFKCVCKLWRDLIAQPANRKKLPQTLAGFLYTTHAGGYYRHHLAGVSATVVDFVDPSLSFLRPMNYTKIYLEDTCNGLLLCSCCYNNKEKRLVVCNPATRRWTELPPPPQPQPDSDYLAKHLAFDPAVSPSHFHVLAFEGTGEDFYIRGVSIYSSRTGVWTHRNIELLDKICLMAGGGFVGGMLHLLGALRMERRGYGENLDNYVLLVVDMEGKTWKTLRLPSGFCTCAIGWSQGCLHYATRSYRVYSEEIAVWCLEDYDSQKWALKNTVRIDNLLDLDEMQYLVVGFHPDCDTVFFVTRGVHDGDSSCFFIGIMGYGPYGIPYYPSP